MARASGAAADGMVSVPADFVHKPSGVHYRITESGGHVYLDYDRPENAKSGGLHGQEELHYFVGSGTRGRTFLFQREGYWFETPINWYAKKGIWDMAPNYQRAQEMPLTLPADSGCLSCHASNVQPALARCAKPLSGSAIRDWRDYMRTMPWRRLGAPRTGWQRANSESQ